MGIIQNPHHGRADRSRITGSGSGAAYVLMIITALGAALLFSTGCTGPQQAVKKTPPPEQKEKTQPPELKEIVLPQKGEAAAQPQRLYSLQMRDAEVQDLLLAFSREANVNIVADPRVSGRVTVDLKGVSLEQALDIICGQLNLEYKRDGNIIKVNKPELTSRIFLLDYITTIRKRKGVASGGVGGRPSGGGGSSSGQAGYGQASSSQPGSAGYSEVTTEDESDLWKEIDKGLQALKSSDGVVSLQKSSNTVMVKDYPANIRYISEFLNTVTGSIQQQVLIEAQIIEVFLNDDFKAGINWGYIQSLPQMTNLSWGLATNGDSPWLGYPGTTGSGVGGGSGTNDQTQTIPGKFVIKPFGGVFRIGGQDQVVRLNDIIEALSTQGDVNVLSSPKVSTLNNQPAIIKVASEDPYFQTTRTTVYGETDTTQEVYFLTIGVVLSVTPQISADGTIMLDVHPTVTDKTGEKVSRTGDSVPIVDVRETDTVVRVNDRETILIAGLMQNKVFESRISVPLLGDMPLLGYLFRHIARETRKTELVIMLTPRIMTAANVTTITTSERQRFDETRSDIDKRKQKTMP